MSGVVSDNGKQRQNRSGSYLGLLGLAAAWVVYAILWRANAPSPSYDASNIPGCVSQTQWKVEGDIQHDRLRYQSFTRVETDDKAKHELFLARVIEKTSQDGKRATGNDMYLTFAVFHRYNRRVYRQTASAIVCQRQFGSSENQCRNRNYYFFRHIDPITLANVLVDDIASYKPLIRKCVWDKNPHE